MVILLLSKKIKKMKRLLLITLVSITLLSCAKGQEQKQEQEQEIDISLEDLRSIDKRYKFEKLFKALNFKTHSIDKESETYVFGKPIGIDFPYTANMVYKDDFIVMGLVFNNEKTYNKIINAVKIEFEKVGESEGNIFYKDKENLTTISFNEIGYKENLITIINSRRR